MVRWPGVVSHTAAAAAAAAHACRAWDPSLPVPSIRNLHAYHMLHLACIPYLYQTVHSVYLSSTSWTESLRPQAFHFMYHMCGCCLFKQTALHHSAYSVYTDWSCLKGRHTKGHVKLNCCDFVRCSFCGVCRAENGCKIFQSELQPKDPTTRHVLG